MADRDDTDPGEELPRGGTAATLVPAGVAFACGLVALGTTSLALGALAIAAAFLVFARLSMLDHDHVPTALRAGAAVSATIGFLAGILAVVVPLL